MSAVTEILMDHPRIRGEHGVDLALHAGQAGSSPHTRGARRGLRQVGADVGIIPAYAGSTRIRGLQLEALGDHPRIRGEHDFDLEAIVDELGSSPHTRGARVRRGRQDPPGRIIPAYAGSTKSLSAHRLV